MTASFQLTLDTHAPRLTWGAVTGTVIGDELTVGYAVDEPGVLSATATLTDGRVLPMAVSSNALRVTLPDDTPDSSYVTIRATLRDSVWNTATATTQVLVTGGVGPPPPPPVPVGQSASPAAPAAPTRIIRSEISRASARSDYGTTAVVSATSAASLSVRYLAPTERALAWATAIVTSSTARSHAAVGGVERYSTGSKWTVTKRPEGPDAEDELAVLLLL